MMGKHREIRVENILMLHHSSPVVSRGKGERSLGHIYGNYYYFSSSFSYSRIRPRAMANPAHARVRGGGEGSWGKEGTRIIAISIGRTRRDGSPTLARVATGPTGGPTLPPASIAPTRQRGPTGARSREGARVAGSIRYLAAKGQKMAAGTITFHGTVCLRCPVFLNPTLPHMEVHHDDHDLRR